jgi:hypothetical protein
MIVLNATRVLGTRIQRVVGDLYAHPSASVRKVPFAAVSSSGGIPSLKTEPATHARSSYSGQWHISTEAVWAHRSTMLYNAAHIFLLDPGGVNMITRLFSS